MSAGWNRKDAGLFLLALAWLALTLGVRPLALPDEGRYVSVAWEMLNSGNWLYPTLNGLPFFHKPPLFYWITAASLGVFGTHEWAGRLAPLFGAGIAAFALYGFALRQKGAAVARVSLLILVTQPFFFGGAQFANLDMLVAGLIVGAVLLVALGAWYGLSQLVVSVPPEAPFALPTFYLFLFVALTATTALLAWLALLPRPGGGRLAVDVQLLRSRRCWVRPGPVHSSRTCQRPSTSPSSGGYCFL